MTKGRPKLPNEIKKLQGTDQPCRMSESLEVIKFDDISQIKAIKVKGLESASARKIFNDRASMLIANKILSPQDIDLLIIYSNALDQVIASTKMMKKGLFKETKDDQGRLKGYISNPYIKHFKDNSDLVIKIGSEFGFSPISRMRFGAEPEKEKDPLQKLLEQFNND